MAPGIAMLECAKLKICPDKWHERIAVYAFVRVKQNVVTRANGHILHPISGAQIQCRVPEIVFALAQWKWLVSGCECSIYAQLFKLYR